MFLKHSLAILFFIKHYYVCAIDHSLIDSYHPKPTALIKSYEKILKMSLESLYMEDEREFNVTAQSILMSKNCSLTFEEFSNSVVNFTRCALKYARPIHICVECENDHNNSVQSYNNLKGQSQECREKFFSSDQVAIVNVLYQDVIQLWSDNYCENCYLNPNLTESFFEVSNDLMKCIFNSDKANSTCVKCHDMYANISDKYSLFVKSPGDYGQVCMDVVDTMNITRRLWKDHNCTALFDTSIGYPNIIVALAIGVTPVLFYLLAKNVSIIEDVKIVRPKRKFAASITPEAPKE